MRNKFELPDVVAVILVVYKIAETLSESSEFNDFLKVVQEVYIKLFRKNLPKEETRHISTSILGAG